MRCRTHVRMQNAHIFVCLFGLGYEAAEVALVYWRVLSSVSEGPFGYSLLRQSFGEGAHSNRTWLLGGREHQWHSSHSRLQEEAILATKSTPQTGRYPPPPATLPRGKAISDLISACAQLPCNTLGLSHGKQPFVESVRKSQNWNHLNLCTV